MTKQPDYSANAVKYNDEPTVTLKMDRLTAHAVRIALLCDIATNRDGGAHPGLAELQQFAVNKLIIALVKTG